MIDLGKPFRAMLLHGDSRVVLRRLPEASIDSIVTDPPYDLTSADGAGGGFMNKAWDATGIAFDPTFWAEVLRVLKPGGYLLAFGGTRTYHRMTCAIEDSGFQIRDCILYAYGAGFPKSLDISKAIDKAASTDDVKRWQGWGTALKPALEPILCVQKPLTLVPELDRLLRSTDQEIAQWLALNTPVESAVVPSMSNLHGLPVAGWPSAPWRAAVTMSGASFVRTAMSRSPAQAGTFWSIVWLWNSILDVLCSLPSMYTIETASETITALKILNSLTSPNTHANTQKDQTPNVGLTQPVQPAVNASSDVNKSLSNTPEVSVRDDATSPNPVTFLRILVLVAENLSAHLRRTEESIAHSVAQTGNTPRNVESPGDPQPAPVVLPRLQQLLEETLNIVGVSAPAKHNVKRPSNLPIVMARKPLEGTVAANVLKYGTGGLNIDACRIRVVGEVVNSGLSDPANRKGVVGTAVFDAATPRERFQQAQIASLERTNTLGRWPANLIHDGTPEVAGLFPQNAGETGSAARFFNPCTPDNDPDDPLWNAPPLFYTSKPSRAERDAGCEDLPARTAVDTVDRDPESAGAQSPRAGAGRTATDDRGVLNGHPTVKPISLLRHLVKLVTPPGGIVLDPFGGSGSTGCAAVLEGARVVLIEREAEYAPLIQARLKHWTAKAKAGGV